MKREKLWLICLAVISLISLALHAGLFYLSTSFSDGFIIIPLVMYSDLPYLLGFLLYLTKTLNTLAFLGLICAFMTDIYSLYSIYISPQNSTAGLNLMSAPVVSLIMVLLFFLTGKAFSVVKSWFQGA